MSKARLGRGVWKAAYTVNGRDLLLAVDSRADCLKAIVLTPDVDEIAATESLEALLDASDPVPSVRLVERMAGIAS